MKKRQTTRMKRIEMTEKEQRKDVKEQSLRKMTKMRMMMKTRQ
jgi:hypothetical protein